ncbi:hypothetical protein LZ554_001961 [Drepanopeziza brunnea f. sp. 'monogermtubi']|nr:hypothetical protein LZ554_001961 [Drepanopeziza brunnea f. sp. 'monogermtubi']
MATLNDLPEERLQQVVEAVDMPSLLALSSTSRVFHRLATSQLYQTVEQNPQLRSLVRAVSLDGNAGPCTPPWSANLVLDAINDHPNMRSHFPSFKRLAIWQRQLLAELPPVRDLECHTIP